MIMIKTVARCALAARTLLILLPLQPAQAAEEQREDWMFLAETPGGSLAYVDVLNMVMTNKHETNTRARVWIRTDSRNNPRRLFASTEALYQIECDQRTAVLLEGHALDGQGNTVQSIPMGSPENVRPGTTIALAARLVCHDWLRR